MIYSFATTSMHSLQQFGSTAAVGGIFLAVYLMTLVAIIITVVLLAWGGMAVYQSKTRQTS